MASAITKKGQDQATYFALSLILSYNEVMGGGRLLIFFLLLSNFVQAANGHNWANSITTFSCLNDLITLRDELVKVYSRHKSFPGTPQQRRTFRNDHRAMENLIWPSPQFPFHVMEKLDFYRKRLIPGHQYFNGQQILVGKQGLKKARSDQLWSTNGETFYRSVFTQAKHDLTLLRRLGLSSTPPTLFSRGRFSDHFQDLPEDEQKNSYFDSCSALFQEDTVSSPFPAVKNTRRRQIPASIPASTPAASSNTSTTETESRSNSVLP